MKAMPIRKTTSKLVSLPRAMSPTKLNMSTPMMVPVNLSVMQMVCDMRRAAKAFMEMMRAHTMPYAERQAERVRAGDDHAMLRVADQIEQPRREGDAVDGVGEERSPHRLVALRSGQAARLVAIRGAGRVIAQPTVLAMPTAVYRRASESRQGPRCRLIKRHCRRNSRPCEPPCLIFAHVLHPRPPRVLQRLHCFAVLHAGGVAWLGEGGGAGACARLCGCA